MKLAFAGPALAAVLVAAGLAFAPAVSYAQAASGNIGLMACENTMRNTKVKREDMHAGISCVDAGVVHLMKRQREGWAYIRP